MTHDTPRRRIPLMTLGPPQTAENMTELGRNPHVWRGKAWQLRRVADLALVAIRADRDATFAAMRFDDGGLDALKAMPPTADGPFFFGRTRSGEPIEGCHYRYRATLHHRWQALEGLCHP